MTTFFHNNHRDKFDPYVHCICNIISFQKHYAGKRVNMLILYTTKFQTLQITFSTPLTLRAVRNKQVLYIHQLVPDIAPSGGRKKKLCCLFCIRVVTRGNGQAYHFLPWGNLSPLQATISNSDTTLILSFALNQPLGQFSL